jgi:hypothetical protein
MARTPAPADPGKAYRVLIGLDYPENRRAEPGDVVTDLPGYAVAWLLETGAIELKED